MLEINDNSNWIISSEFDNPEELVKRVCDAIKENGEKIFKHEPIHVASHSGQILTVRLDTINENGMVCHVLGHADNAAGKYDVLTEAAIIIKNDGNIKYILSGVDGRRNDDASFVTVEGRHLKQCNVEQIKSELSALGQKIDDKKLENSSSIFNRKKQKTLMQRKADLYGIIVTLGDSLSKEATKPKSM